MWLWKAAALQGSERDDRFATEPTADARRSALAIRPGTRGTLQLTAKMQAPGPLLAERYVAIGAFKVASACGQRWMAADSKNGRRVIAAIVEAGRLSTLEAGCGVKHRHLAGIIDVVREPNVAAIPDEPKLAPGAGVGVCEFVPGRSLRGVLADGALNPAKAVAWTLRLIDAVQALHEAGAVHGAISPRSVIAEPEGRVIAPVLSQLMVPPIGAYCPPERLKGSAETYADDVWALHATLYTMLTRELPFNAKTREALLKQMLSKPKPLSAFGIQEPVLQEIINRGLIGDKRLRVTELSELLNVLDSWERDRNAMPPKRAVVPATTPRGFHDIVSGAKLAKAPEDGILFDDSSLPDDESKELSARSLPLAFASSAPPTRISSEPNAVSLPPSSEPIAPPIMVRTPDLIAEEPRALPAVPKSPALPKLAFHRISKRISINPFERKRPVWPMLMLAAVAGGGGVYLAVSPSSGEPPKKEVAVAPVAAKVPRPAPSLKKQKDPKEERNACVRSHFPDGAFAGDVNFEFVCGDDDFREVSTRLHALAADGLSGSDAGIDAGVRSGLEWYELPATAIIRKSCCSTSTPVVLPETVGWCEQLQSAVRRIAEDSAKGTIDLAPSARSFDKAVTCLFANKVPSPYAYPAAPSPDNRQKFQQFLSRAAISDARR